MARAIFCTYQASRAYACATACIKWRSRIWIPFFGKFLQNPYLLLLYSFTCLCLKDDDQCFFYKKLIAVIYMSNHRSYSKEMTLQLIMLLNISSSDTETNPGSLEFINRFAVHNLSKVSLLEAMATTWVQYYVCRQCFLILCLTCLMTELILKDTIF